jgi:hypothetical protein
VRGRQNSRIHPGDLNQYQPLEVDRSRPYIALSGERKVARITLSVPSASSGWEALCGGQDNGFRTRRAAFNSAARASICDFSASSSLAVFSARIIT